MKKIALSYLCTAIVAVVIVSFGVNTKEVNAFIEIKYPDELICPRDPDKKVKRCNWGPGDCRPEDQELCVPLNGDVIS